MRCTNPSCPNVDKLEVYRNRLAQLGLLLDKMRKLLDSEQTIMNIIVQENKKDDADAGNTDAPER